MLLENPRIRATVFSGRHYRIDVIHIPRPAFGRRVFARYATMCDTGKFSRHTLVIYSPDSGHRHAIYEVSRSQAEILARNSVQNVFFLTKPRFLAEAKKTTIID
jgi:hypothetical protein